MLTLALWLAAALLAYTIKGFSGFGPALIVVPALSILFTPATALSTSALIDVVVGAAFLTYLGMTRSEARQLARMLVALVTGTVLGAAAVSWVPRPLLLGLVGVTVLILAVQLLRTGRPGFVPRRPLPLQVSAFAAGLSGGLIGVSGPFMVAGTAHLDKGSIRRLLVAVFLIEGVVRVVTYMVTGAFTSEVFGLALVAAPAVALGMLAGIWLHTRVSEARFTVVIGAILMVVGVQTLVAAVI